MPRERVYTSRRTIWEEDDQKKEGEQRTEQREREEKEGEGKDGEGPRAGPIAISTKVQNPGHKMQVALLAEPKTLEYYEQ